MSSTGLALLLIFSFVSAAQNGNPCVPRSFGLSSIVCVCNSFYCDTIAPPVRTAKGKYAVYTSTQSGERFLKEEAQVRSYGKLYGDDVLLHINRREQYQTIIGWGGAFTDSTGMNILSLNPGASEKLLRSYFSEEGLEYNLCRVPIGGTDFSTHGYSYDDSSNPDPDLKHFKLAPEDFKYKIPLIKTAQNVTNGKLKLFGSAWTAPKWMKYNGRYTGPDLLRKTMYQPWANYFVKFLKGYKDAGITFWGITTGNEPSTGLLPVKINSVGWLPEQMRDWIANNLGPTIRSSEFSNIKIIAIDDQVITFPWAINKIFNEPKNRQYVDGFGVHWYWNFLVSHKQLTTTNNKYPEKFILSTEACEGSYPWQTSVLLGEWKRAETYAGDIIRDLQNWVTGWIDWNMALDTNGGPTYINNNVDSPIIVNATAGEFYKQPMYYAMGHFSKFIPEGSQRIGVKQSSDKIEVVAFARPDNGTAIVILNRKRYNISIVLRDSETNIERRIPAKSITTILYWL